jgi:hypothetical protein
MRAEIVQWVGSLSPEMVTVLAIGLVTLITIAIVLAVRPEKARTLDDCEDWCGENYGAQRW